MEDFFTIYCENDIAVSLFLVFEKQDEENGIVDLDSAKEFIEDEIFERIKNGKNSGDLDFVFKGICYSGKWNIEHMA